jgi:uncharacterized protein YeaO (DUF488 family)
MKIDVSKETYEAKWVDYGDMIIRIEPYPIGKNDLVIEGNDKMVIPGSQREKMFMDSVLDWKKLVDKNGKEILCTKDIKQLVYDRNLGGIAGFVYQYNATFEQGMRNELENLHSGQDGILTETMRPAKIVKKQ